MYVVQNSSCLLFSLLSFVRVFCWLFMVVIRFAVFICELSCCYRSNAVVSLFVFFVCFVLLTFIPW